MNVEHFLAHFELSEHPFDAEEALHDSVFNRMMGATACHPDFSKILGQIDPPSTSVVFGEKGSGKTAIRMMIDQRVRSHNEENPQRSVLLVVYDDLNPVLDRLMLRLGQRSKPHSAQSLASFRLEDHQDAILSLAVTAFIDSLVNQAEKGSDRARRIKEVPRRLRVNAAVLAALYDQPRDAAPHARWHQLRRKLRVGRLCGVSMTAVAAIILSLGAAALLTAHFLAPPLQFPWWLLLGGIVTATALLGWARWILSHCSLWWTCRRIHREIRVVDRKPAHLRQMLLSLRPRDLESQNWPSPAADSRNSRYDLTARLVELLAAFGHSGLMVVVDRVDEPTIVSGNAECMRSLVWPMLDNKFLQQDRVGFKLLLPIELRHALHRESAAFFQEARLDKQHLVDRLTWSGATLYDLCTSRLRTCCERDEANPIALTELFTQDVTRDMLVDALDQMLQPRDAFKFLYNVIAEHCRMVPEDQAAFEIPRLTLDSVRRSQSLRVQELQRGLAPA